MAYGYKAGKKRINGILNSPNEITVMGSVPKMGAFNYQNGICAPVAAIFVDIRDSSTYFTKQPKKQVAQMIRAFVNELIEIFSNNKNHREIGIRGDCVYAIYNASSKGACESVIDDAATANTLMNMLNSLLEQRRYKRIKAGIGIGYDDKQLVVKAGNIQANINSFVWIGNAVIDASNCASFGNRGNREAVIISERFFEKIKDLNANDRETYSDLFRKFSDCGKIMRECSIVNTAFNEWLKNGMKG